jgi:DNA processing protein
VNDETFFCLALSLVPGLGTGHIHPLLKECGSASAVLALSRSELKRLRLSSEAAQTIAGGFAQKSAEETLRSARSKKIRVLSLFDRAYPDLLKQIFDPPLVDRS